MEEKYNFATPQRPAGSRPLDAPVIPINIPKHILQIKLEEAYAKNGKNAITIFKSEQVTITLIALQAGEDFHPGSEENKGIMSLQVISGRVYFESQEENVELNEGELLTLHQKLAFKAKANDESICLLTLVKES